MRIHFAGGGRTAEYVAHRLIRENHTLVVMDWDESRIRALAEILDAQIVLGNVTSIESCRKADLAKADIFVACTNSDETNVLACLIADDLAPEAIKVLALSTPEFADWDRMLQTLKVRVDRVVHPESDIVARILRVLTVAGVSDIRHFCDRKVKAFAMHLDEGSPVLAYSTALLKAENLNDTQVCAIFRGSEAIIPSENQQLLPGDNVYVVTKSDTFDDALLFMGIEQGLPTRKVFIIGGGEIGLELAKALEAQRVSVKLFEPDSDRCEVLAAELVETIIINSDGTDQETLLREGVEGIDAFISLTGDDSDNLIASLLARRLGAYKVIPRINRLSNQGLAQRLGISTTVSPRVKTADALLEYIRGGGVLSVRTLGEEEAEAIEVEVPAGASYSACPLNKLSLPAGVMIGAIVSVDGTVKIPTGEEIIEHGDRVVFFVHERAITHFETSVLGRSRRK